MTAHTVYKALINTTPRSYLFVPATRTDRIIKALASKADAIIIDLEDAVSDSDKHQARIDLKHWFANTYAPNYAQINPYNKPVWVRINNIGFDGGAGSDSEDNFQQDLQLFQDLLPPLQPCPTDEVRANISGIVLPKVENSETLEHAHQVTHLPIIIQIETATGINNLQELTTKSAIKGVHSISYGKLDLCNELNMRLGSQAQTDFINNLRYQLTLISKANGLHPPIESIYPDFKDDEGLSQTAGYVADLGFSGMLAIHPLQIDSIHDAFASNEKEIDFANKVVAHYQATGESAYAIDGVMVDLPAIRQCERMLTTHK